MKNLSIDKNIKTSKQAESTKKLAFLLEADAVRILNDYNIPYPRHGLAHNPEEAVRIAQEIGYPVVLKIASPDIIHKSDVGGVALGNNCDHDVYRNFSKILHRVLKENSKISIEGILVCREAQTGVEVIIGAVEDATFGPTIMFGMGGIYAEAMDDVSFRIAPLDKRDAEEMVRETKGYPLLTGIRGCSAIDMHKLVELIMNVSRLITEHPEIRQLDLNPIRLYPDGLLVLDVRMLRTIKAS